MRRILYVTEEKVNINSENDQLILIATKQPYLFDYLKKDIEIISLELENELPYEETWSLLDKLNKIIKESVDSSRSWVYEASYHIEGNGIGQSFADVLSSVQVISDILTAYYVDEINIYPSEDNIIECQVFWKLAKIKGITVKENYKNIKAILLYNNHSIINSFLKKVSYLWISGKKYSSYIHSIKMSLNHESNSYELGIINASDTQKTISWKEKYIYSMAKAFPKMKLMCLNSPFVAGYFSDNKINTDIMEKWLEKSNIKKRKKEYIFFLRKIIPKISSELKYCYKDYDITEILKQYIYIHILLTIPNNLYIDAVCEGYFKYNKFSVMLCHGNSNFIETRAMYYNTRCQDTLLYRKEDLSVFTTKMYEPYQDIINIRFFCQKEGRYNELKNQGWNGNAFFIQDTKYIPKFYNTYVNRIDKKSDVRTDIKIVWCPSYVVKGITTYDTFKKNNSLVASWFEENKYSLLMKFHPHQNMNQINDLVDMYGNSKYIRIADKNESFSKILEDIDIVITDKSLCIFDGIVERKPVMVLCSPYHYELIKQHSEGLRIYTDADEMFTELKRIESDSSYFEKWKAETLQLQDQYFLKYKKDKDGLCEMIEVLKDYVKNKEIEKWI